MRPNKLTLENFGPYRERATVDFSALGDFFLICGKTGSGKSTLFDAMTYALYGKAPGARKSHENSLVSSFAEPGDKPFVEFEFELFGSKYKVERTPPYYRKKRAGAAGDVVLVSPNATLSRFSSAWEVIEQGQDKVSKSVEKLIGLTVDEFSKVILLPQGEFQEFLEMNSKERSAILERIFPVELHTRVTELAKERSDEARQRLGNLDSQISELETELGEEPEARLSALNDTVLTAQRQEDEALERVRARQRSYDALQTRFERLKKVKEAVDLVAALQQQKPVEDARSEKIRKAKAANRVLPYIETFERAGRSLKNATTDAQEAQGAYEAHLAKAEERDHWQERLVGLVDLIGEAQEEEIRLEARVEKWKQRLAALEALDVAQQAVSRAEKAAEAKAKERAELEHELQGARPSQDEVIKIRVELEKLHDLREEFLKFEAKIGRKAELEAEFEARKKAVETCERAYRAAQEDAERAKAAQEALSGRLGQAEAVHLALQLREGEPCPVCGSVHHPAPAVPPSAMGLLDVAGLSRAAGFADASGLSNIGELPSLSGLPGAPGASEEATQIASLREELERASQDANKASMTLAGAQASLDSARQRLAEVEEQLKAINGEIATLRETQPALEKWLGSEFSEFLGISGISGSRVLGTLGSRDAVEAAKERLGAALKASQEALEEFDRRFKRADELEAKLKALVMEEQSQAAALQEARSRCAVCKATLTVAEADSGTLDPGPDYEAAVAHVDALVKERDSLQKACQDWERLKASLLARKDSLELALQNAKGAFAQEAARLVEVMQAEGFLPPDFVSGDERKPEEATAGAATEAGVAQALEVAIAHVRECAVPPRELAAQEVTEATYRENLTKAVATAQALMATAEEVAGGDQVSDGLSQDLTARLEAVLEECRVGLEEQGGKLEAANREFDEARQTAEHLRRDLQRLGEGIGRLKDKKAEREKAFAESRSLYSLQTLLSGEIGGRRLPFKNFVLGMYFGEVVLRASNHLSQMSDGRFYLKQAQGEGAGRAKTGLDIAVLDAWTGTERPTDTLSGGEKFLTSISLALGLADSIRERAGGVALDSVFIDEGFGSLDDESLEKAIIVLNRIRGTRTIGIVSHVAELRSRIPARIEVEKSPSGSHLHIVSVPDQAE